MHIIFHNIRQVAIYIYETKPLRYVYDIRHHKKMVVCLNMASGPFVRYLLELHIDVGGTSGIIISIFRATTRDE